MGVFRLQYLTTVFSEQVMSGFVVGGGIHVFFAQIGDTLGIKLPRRSGAGYLYYVGTFLKTKYLEYYLYELLGTEQTFLENR